MPYNSNRKGYETKDGGVIRINGDDKIRIDIYEDNEREKGGHIRDTINYDTNAGKDCYELAVLRWFRDNYVAKEGIKYYYDIAPIIVETINKEEKADLIYDNIIEYCVKQNEYGNYTQANSRYKNSVLILEEQFVRLEHSSIKSLELGR